MKNNFIDKKVIKMDIGSLKKEIIHYISDLIDDVNHDKKMFIEIGDNIKLTENRNNQLQKQIDELVFENDKIKLKIK